MNSRLSNLAPPPSSYSPLTPSDQNNISGKDNTSSTRSTRSRSSSTFSFKNARGFKRVFGLLGKESSGGGGSGSSGGGEDLNVGSRFFGGRRDSESTAATRTAGIGMVTSQLPPFNANANAQSGTSRLGNESTSFYRARNARSMDALKLFTKGTNNKQPVSNSKQRMSTDQRSPASDPSANVIIIRPSGGDDKDMPVLRLEDEEADDAGNGSTSTESDRSATRMEGASYLTDAHSPMPTLSGIGGTPPPGAKGAVHLPTSPPRMSASFVNPARQIQITKAASESATPGQKPEAQPTLPPARSRPSKPSLSIPILIPPRTSHEKAASASAVLPSQSPPANMMSSPSGPPATHSAHTPSSSQKMKGPPSPGFGLSLRLTPSIVMSRPAWPLPPLPPMPNEIPPVPPGSGSLSGMPGAAGSGLAWNMSNGKVLPMFRLSPPTRSMTGPTTGNSSSSASEGLADASVWRSVSVKLNAMPSLSVMGETEHGDPEADDMMDEDEEEDMDMDEEGEDIPRPVPMGRPSIDSVMSMDSATSVDTVRAAPPPPLKMPPSTSRADAQQIPVGGPIAPEENAKGKGKGKVKKQEDVEEDGDGGSASDSDDSVYFDARDSVFLSPKDVAKELERRHSQISQRTSRQNPSSSGPGIGGREGLQDVSRDRRDSSWSFSTAGRESVYLTPSEGSAWSAAATPRGSAIIATASDLAHSGFATEINAKRSSVPVTFGATVGNNAAVGSLSSRRAAGSRFSMITAAELPSIDSSSLNFDASQFSAKTPGAAPLLPDGLPTTRRDGLPNFDAAVPFTRQAVDSSEVVTPKERTTPKTDDYFHTRMIHPPTSHSNQRRRGSVSASVSVPAPIAEDAVTTAAVERDGQKTPVSATSPIASPTPVSGPDERSSILVHPKRPSVYRQASRSMVDLSTVSGMGMDDEEEVDHKAGPSVICGPPILTASSPLQRTPTQSGVDAMAWIVPPPSPAITRPSAHRQSTLRRVSSVPLLQSTDMPITLVEKPPPAYHAIPRREEEGKEVLPSYYNDIILAGLLPRKMEFDRPGLQARDRSWKKHWCVLQGTMFRVYKVGTLEAKFGALASAPVAGGLPSSGSLSVLPGGRVRGSTVSTLNIGNRRGSNATPPSQLGTVIAEESGFSEKASLNNTARADLTLTKNQQKSTPPGLLAPPSAGFPASPSSATMSATARSGSSQAPSRSSFSSSRPTTPSRPTSSGSTPYSPTYGSALGSRSREYEPPTGHGLGGRSVIDNGGSEIYTPASSSLSRQYTLQNAESGLATDYMKRPNVIRIRLEGEQFLLQLPGVEEVVEWIEGFQAAANIALDLDVRPMPKGAMYPRRRRRRRPRQPGEPATQSPLSPPPNTTGSGTTTPRLSASQTTPNSAPPS